MDIGHLSHPVYGAPELATALVENPAEYLPIVSGCCGGCTVLISRRRSSRSGGSVLDVPACCHHPLLLSSTGMLLACPAMPLPQFEQAAKQESQRIQNLMEDGSDPEVLDVQVRWQLLRQLC